MAHVRVSAPPATQGLILLLVVGSGIVASLQVGKAAIATPMIRTDLGLDLAAIGWLTGIFAVLGLVGGIPAGAMAAGMGSRRMLVLGLLATAAGSALGGGASSYPMLLASRIVEGAGFLFITVAGPSILPQVVDVSRRDFAFASWSCFMPAGIAIAMLAGPLFGDWRTIWWASSAVALVAALGVQFVVPAAGENNHWSWHNLGADAAATIKAGGPAVLAAIFALYSLMFFALFSFLPTLLMDRMAVTHQVAGLLSALATAANIVGNLAAGLLLSRGIGRPVLIAAASLGMGAAGLGIFLPILPDLPTFLLCVLFSLLGGLVPATLLSTAPIVAPVAGLMPIIVGLVMQGSNLGQIAGPVAVGSVTDAWGWPAASLVVGLVAVLAAAGAAVLSGILACRERS